MQRNRDSTETSGPHRRQHGPAADCGRKGELATSAILTSLRTDAYLQRLPNIGWSQAILLNPMAVWRYDRSAFLHALRWRQSSHRMTSIVSHERTLHEECLPCIN